MQFEPREAEIAKNQAIVDRGIHDDAREVDVEDDLGGAERRQERANGEQPEPGIQHKDSNVHVLFRHTGQFRFLSRGEQNVFDLPDEREEQRGDDDAGPEPLTCCAAHVLDLPRAQCLSGERGNSGNDAAAEQQEGREK